MAKFGTNASGAIWWPNLQLMQLWCHLVAKFVTNASGVVWWPNLQLILVAPSGGQICNKCNYGAIWWPSDHEVCFSTDHVCISSLVLGIFVFWKQVFDSPKSEVWCPDVPSCQQIAKLCQIHHRLGSRLWVATSCQVALTFRLPRFIDPKPPSAIFFCGYRWNMIIAKWIWYIRFTIGAK